MARSLMNYTVAEAQNAALGGTAILGTFAASYRAAATDVHFRTIGAGGAFSAGSMCYIVEYIELDNNG